MENFRGNHSPSFQQEEGVSFTLSKVAVKAGNVEHLLSMCKAWLPSPALQSQKQKRTKPKQINKKQKRVTVTQVILRKLTLYH